LDKSDEQKVLRKKEFLDIRYDHEDAWDEEHKPDNIEEMIFE